MASFCHIKNAYNGDSMDDLDRMARSINNNRKHGVKNVFNEYRNEEKQLREGIQSLQDIEGFSVFPGGQYAYSSYYPRDFDGTLISNIHKSKNKEVQPMSDGISLESPDSMSNDSDSSGSSNDSSFTHNTSNYTLSNATLTEDTNPKKSILKRPTIKSSRNNKHVSFDDCTTCDEMSVDSMRSEEDMIEHANKCSKCKRKVLKLLKNNKESKNKVKEYFVKDSVINSSNGKDNNTNDNTSLKEFIVICVIAVIIIFLIDIVIKSNR